MSRARVSACRRRSSWSGTARPTGTRTTASRATRIRRSTRRGERRRVRSRPSYDDEVFAALYTSPLRRAAETAAIIGYELGLEPRPDDALKEVDVGSWSGLTRAEVEQRYPTGFARWLEYGHGWDDGETYDELGARVVTGLTRIAERHDGGDVLAITHGGPIRSALAGRRARVVRRGASLDPRHRQLRGRETRRSGRQTRASRLTASWRTTRTIYGSCGGARLRPRCVADVVPMAQRATIRFLEKSWRPRGRERTRCRRSRPGQRLALRFRCEGASDEPPSHPNAGLCGLSDFLDGLRHALVPPDDQGVENDDVQRQRGQQPQQVVRVAEEAELAEHVDAHQHDRRPPRPACASEQSETDTRQEGRPRST